jgi:hypothetical protein
MPKKDFYTDDNDNPDIVLRYVQECANAWEPDVRLLGNVRARDVSKSVDRILSQRDFYKKRVDLIQECLKEMKEPEKTLLSNILANAKKSI